MIFCHSCPLFVIPAKAVSVPNPCHCERSAAIWAWCMDEYELLFHAKGKVEGSLYCS